MSFSLKQNTALYLDSVNGKGVGLFCSSHIKLGDVIESCIAIAFNHTEASLIDQTNLYNYYFSLSFLTDKQAEEMNILDKDNSGCIALGMLSMANHSETPNCRIHKDVCDKRVVLSLTAIKDIQAHQEITFSYGKIWFDQVP